MTMWRGLLPAVSVAFAFAAGVASAAPAAPEIPAPFRGEWNADLRACGSGSHDSRLRISARQVSFYESSGTVLSVTRLSDRRIRLTVRLSGEGEAWTAESTFELSADGRRLTDLAEGGAFVRHRCPTRQLPSP